MDDNSDIVIQTPAQLEAATEARAAEQLIELRKECRPLLQQIGLAIGAAEIKNRRISIAIPVPPQKLGWDSPFWVEVFAHLQKKFWAFVPEGSGPQSGGGANDAVLVLKFRDCSIVQRGL